MRTEETAVSQESRQIEGLIRPYDCGHFGLGQTRFPEGMNVIALNSSKLRVFTHVYSISFGQGNKASRISQLTQLTKEQRSTSKLNSRKKMPFFIINFRNYTPRLKKPLCRPSWSPQQVRCHSSIGLAPKH